MIELHSKKKIYCIEHEDMYLRKDFVELNRNDDKQFESIVI